MSQLDQAGGPHPVIKRPSSKYQKVDAYITNSGGVRQTSIDPLANRLSVVAPLAKLRLFPANTTNFYYKVEPYSSSSRPPKTSSSFRSAFSSLHRKLKSRLGSTRSTNKKLCKRATFVAVTSRERSRTAHGRHTERVRKGERQRRATFTTLRLLFRRSLISALNKPRVKGKGPHTSGTESTAKLHTAKTHRERDLAHRQGQHSCLL